MTVTGDDLPEESEDSTSHDNPTSSTSPCTTEKDTSNSNKNTTSKAEEIPNDEDSCLPCFPITMEQNVYTAQIKRIIKYHNRGTRTLILMRGAPGSGKSHLAIQIQNMTVGNFPDNEHIFSTDDYFVENGFYVYNAKNIDKAHRWNQRRARYAMARGISPIIIDNTNVEQWELKPYVVNGVRCGYYLEVVEPNTSWSKDVHGLQLRNKHKVSANTIRRMLKGLEIPITPETLIKNLNLSYPQRLKPPVRRNKPEILNFSYQNCTNVKTVMTSQQKDKNINNHNNTGTEIVKGNNIDCKSKCPNEQVNHSLAKEESNSGKVTLNIEKQQFCPGDSVSRNHVENECVNIKVEALPISNGGNLTLHSELMDKCESNQAYSSGNNLQINCDVEKNNICAVQNVPQTSDSSLPQSTFTKIMKPEETLKFLEECQNLEREWDNGESWHEDSNRNKEQLSSSIDGILPKERRTKDVNSEISSEISVDGNDWRKMYKPISSFTDNMSQLNLSSVLSKDMVELKSAATCMEYRDADTTNIKNGSKIISARARDININYVPKLPEKIPEYPKFDKSSMTNDENILGGIHRCRNENKHFIRFRNMFKHLKTEWLKDIFDNCCGDVNWAVSIIMDDMPNNQNACPMLDDKSEIEDDDFDESCDCASFYGIVPDATPTDVNGEHNASLDLNTPNSADISNSVRKQKKNSVLSDSSLALKRQIEQNIVISDEHYSEECLKVRKMRRGVFDCDASTSQNIATGITIQNTKQLDTCSVHSEDSDDDENESSMIETADSECNSDDEFLFSEVEKTVDINVGHEFIRNLDELFGRGDMEYSKKIVTKIKMPVSMINQLNSLWLESLMCQLEAESRSHEEMMKQDEDFARTLAEELLSQSKSGVEQDVPNLKEIMDMELALSLYRKECDAITQKELPMDLAAKLSRKKLYDLFPDIPTKDLDGLMLAHKNDFQVTVRVILENQGRDDILQQENGIRKFIMAQEVDRQNKFLIAEKQRLMEEEDMDVPDTVDVNTLSGYLKEATSHYEAWNRNMQNAKRVIKSNTSVANYYKSIAELHLMQYERCNSAAVITSLHLQAKNFEYVSHLDLHFFRVIEAKFAVDTYIDTQIRRLRMINTNRKVVLFIVTGRGLHSRHGPRIKPAVLRLLNYRKLSYMFQNPGLVIVKVGAQDKLLFELPSNTN